MGATKTQVMNLLELRYDYQSARNVLVNWRKAAGIKDDSENLDDAQLRCLLAYLKNNEAAAERVHAAIERLILTDNGDMPAESIVEAPAAEVVEAPVAEEIAEAPVAEEIAEAPVADENADEAQAADEDADEAQAADEDADEAQAADEDADEAQAADENADNRAAEGGKKKKNKKR